MAALFAHILRHACCSPVAITWAARPFHSSACLPRPPPMLPSRPSGFARSETKTIAAGFARSPTWPAYFTKAGQLLFAGGGCIDGGPLQRPSGLRERRVDLAGRQFTRDRVR